jgi:hypothetical protein
MRAFCSNLHPRIWDGRLIGFASREAGGKQCSGGIVDMVKTRDGNRATFRRAAHTSNLGIMIRIEQVSGSESCEQVAILSLKPIEELIPGVGVIEPSRPLGVKLVLNICGKVQQGDAPGNRWKALSASCPSDLKDQPRLCEVVRLWEAAAYEQAAFGAENTIGVPPASAVHFTVTGDDQPELEKAVEIYCVPHD